MSTRTADATTAVLATGLMGLVAAIVQIRCGRSLGSRVVFDTHGDVVTNAHVLDGASSCTVTLSGGAKQSADVVGRATANDVAVVRLRSATPSPATFADSKKVQVGDFVLAMGNPLGLRSSVTQGIVSSQNRNVAESSSVELSALIHVNMAGQVIGIPTLTATDPEFGGAQAPGIGFAIPSNTVRQVADALIAAG